MKFISKVVAMGNDRLIITIPKEVHDKAFNLKGKHIKVEVEEIVL